MAIPPEQQSAINDLRQKSLMDIVRLGPETMAGDPAESYDVANVLTPLLKGATKLYGKQAQQRATDAVPNVAGVGKPAIDAKPRVPAEGNLEPQDLGYRATQDKAASDVLSPEGQKKFKAQSNRPTDLSLEGQQDQQILDEAAAAVDELSPEQQLQETVATAQRGALNEQQGAKLQESSAGLADEGQAIEVLEGAALGKRYLQSIKEGAPFNWNFIEEPDDVKALMQAVSDSMPEAQLAATRGPTVANAQTLEEAQTQLADSLGVTKKILKRSAGTTFSNAADATAARILLADSAKRLAELSAKVVRGEGGDATMLQFRRQLAIHNGIQLQIKGAQTEAARLLQSFQIPVTGDLPAREAAQLRRDIIEASGGDKKLVQAADGLLRAAREGEGAFNQAAGKGILSKVRDGLETLYINGLLSNPRSNFKNILGNAFFMAYQLPEEFLGGIYGTAERSIQRMRGKDVDYTKQMYAADPLVRIAGWYKSFGDAWAAAKVGFDTGMPGNQISKIEYNAYRSAGDDINHTIFGRSMQRLYRAAQLPSRFLLGGDEFFKVLSQNGELFTAAHRQMKAAQAMGMSPQQVQDEGMMVMLSPRMMREQLELKSSYDTLMSDLGAIGVGMSAFQNTLLGRYVLPFATAPTNDILRTLERIPINPVLVARMLSKDPKVRQKAVGQFTFAGTTFGLISHYAMNGQITGGRPTDKKAREMLPEGWKPYSFVFRGDDFPVDEDGDPLPVFDSYGQPNGPLRYVSYSGLGPAASVVGLTANALEFMSRARSAEDRNSIAAAFIFAATDYFKELPFLQGMSNVLLAMQRQDAQYLYSGPLGSMNFVPGVPNPYSALSRAAERVFDERLTKVSVDFDIYTEEDVISLTDAGALPKNREGQYDFRYVGLAKSDLSTQFLEAVENFYLQGYATNVLSDANITPENFNAEVPIYDTLGRLITDGPSFQENPMLRLFNSMSPIMISNSKAQPEYIKELAALDWPIPATPKKYLKVDLTIAQQSFLTWLAKGDEKDIPPGLAALKDDAGRQFVTSPIIIRGKSFRETLEDTISGIGPEGRAYRKSDMRGKRALINRIHDRFMDAAWQELTSLPTFERLSTAAIDIENLIEEDFRIK